MSTKRVSSGTCRVDWLPKGPSSPVSASVDSLAKGVTIMSKAVAAPAAFPGFDVTSLDSSGAFVKNAGLVLDAISESKVAGHIDLTAAHHTP